MEGGGGGGGFFTAAVLISSGLHKLPLFSVITNKMVFLYWVLWRYSPGRYCVLAVFPSG